MDIEKKESALVCFSGGQDSTTCLFWALKHFASVRAVCFRYGQKHEREIEVARRIAAGAGVPFEVLDMELLGQLTVGDSSLTDATMPMAILILLYPGAICCFLLLLPLWLSSMV